MEQHELKELTDILDERYVQQSTCNTIQAHTNVKFANDDKRIDLLLQKWNMLERVLWILVTATCGTLVSSILGLILR